MAAKKVSTADLVADLTILKHQMAEMQGPVQETLERVKQALVGTEDGQHEGLLSRMAVLERDQVSFQKNIDEILAALKVGDGRMDKLESREQNHFTEIKGLKEVNKSRKHWLWLVLGAILTGAVGFGWSWIEKKVLPDEDKQPHVMQHR